MFVSDLKKWLSEWGKHRAQQVGEGRGLRWNDLRLPGCCCQEEQRAVKGICAFLLMTACPCCPLAAKMEPKSQGKSEAGVTKVRFDVASPFAWIETKF